MVSDEKALCLQKLYATLLQFCRCAGAKEGGEYQANVGVNFISRSAGYDGLTAHLFFLHDHQGNTTGLSEWKEAHLRVVLERYVSHAVPTCRYQVDALRTAAYGHLVTCSRVV